MTTHGTKQPLEISAAHSTMLQELKSYCQALPPKWQWGNAHVGITRLMHSWQSCQARHCLLTSGPSCLLRLINTGVAGYSRIHWRGGNRYNYLKSFPFPLLSDAWGNVNKGTLATEEYSYRTNVPLTRRSNLPINQELTELVVTLICCDC